MAVAALMLILLGLLIGGVVARDAITGRGDIMSLRNLFLASFSVFQISSGLFAIVPAEFGEWHLSDPDGTSQKFAMMAWAFTIIFLLVYGWGPVAKALGRRVPGEDAAPNTASLLLLAALILGVGILFKLVLIYIPVFGPLSDKIGSAQLALAVGLAMWAWAPRITNPVIAAYAGMIILTAMGTSLIGNYGRRDLLSVVAVAGWAMYHGWWKLGGFTFAAKRLALACGAGVVLLAGYSSVRSHELLAGGPVAVARAMLSADFGEGTFDVFHGQYSANISMWLIESRPDSYDYERLHSLNFAGTMIIPRQFYPDKPEGLGIRIPDQIYLYGKGEGFSVGPGMVGHIQNDNPYLTLWMYPIIMALLFRFADEAMRSRAFSPFIILPAGAALGEVIGLARGELGLFAFNAVAGIVSAYATMMGVRLVLGWFGWQPIYDEGEPDWFDEHNPFGVDDEPPEWYGEAPDGDLDDTRSRPDAA